MIMGMGFFCAVLGGVLYGGAGGKGWESVGKGATVGALVGMAIGLYAVLTGA